MHDFSGRQALHLTVRAIVAAIEAAHPRNQGSILKEAFLMDTLLALSSELAGAVERAARYVVGVNARRRFGSTGVHWQQGLIVTADHTVEVDEDITVTTPDGRTLAATVAGRDPAIDVAVLRVDTGDLTIAEITAEPARVGHIVLAVGRGPRASWGLVSAIGDGRRRRPEAADWLSLDLTLYPGFSGGPLIDARGRVVGMTTSGAARHFQIAIPAGTVDRTVDELMRRGRIPRPYLGVGTQTVRLSEGLRERLQTDQRSAVIVVDVQPDSPAAAAGLMVGDVIVSLGGTRITEPGDLRAVLRPQHVGETVTLMVARGGEPREVRLTIGERTRRS
jgi:S1-C subfamily serine protease